MKNILFLFIMILTLSCSNDREQEQVKPIDKSTPEAYLGRWKVDYLTSNSGNWYQISGDGFYIEFLKDNMVKFRDVNSEYVDFNNEFIGSSEFNLHSNGNSASCTVKRSDGVMAIINMYNSQTHTGYKTFSIHYDNAPSYYEQRFYDAKKQ